MADPDNFLPQDDTITSTFVLPNHMIFTQANFITQMTHGPSRPLMVGPDYFDPFSTLGPSQPVPAAVQHLGLGEELQPPIPILTSPPAFGPPSNSEMSHDSSNSRASSPGNTDLKTYGYQNHPSGTWSCAYPGCTSKAVFTRGCDLRKHHKRHAKSFFCRHPNCTQSSGGGFSNKKDLARHQAKHNPTIYCEWHGCERVFSRLDNMRDHVKRIHLKASRRVSLQRREHTNTTDVKTEPFGNSSAVASANPYVLNFSTSESLTINSPSHSTSSSPFLYATNVQMQQSKERSPSAVIDGTYASMGRPSASPPLPGTPRVAGRPTDILLRPPDGMPLSQCPQQLVLQPTALPKQVEPEPTHVVGKQGRRGILPSAPGRPAPASGKDADGRLSCPNCTKTYLHAKHLKRHMLRHTGDRPYQCKLCKDTFSRSDILKRHFQKCSLRRGMPGDTDHLEARTLRTNKNRLSDGMKDQNYLNAVPPQSAGFDPTAMGNHLIGAMSGFQMPDRPEDMVPISNRMSRASGIMQPATSVTETDEASPAFGI